MGSLARRWNEAPDKALIAAKASAERFPDDQAFQDEYQFMVKLLNPNFRTSL